MRPVLQRKIMKKITFTAEYNPATEELRITSPIPYLGTQSGSFGVTVNQSMQKGKWPESDDFKAISKAHLTFDRAGDDWVLTEMHVREKSKT